MMFTEIDTTSPDGGTLTQVVKDTTEAQTVTIETLSRSVDKGPAGSHAVYISSMGTIGYAVA
jgi:hypothetical protein